MRKERKAKRKIELSEAVEISYKIKKRNSAADDLNFMLEVYCMRSEEKSVIHVNSEDFDQSYLTLLSKKYNLCVFPTSIIPRTCFRRVKGKELPEDVDNLGVEKYGKNKNSKNL